jgi:carboxylate-amine ligase
LTAAEEIAARFDAATPLTVGLEEELMLLDPETLDLAPDVDRALALLNEGARFKRELPASQIESLSRPCATVAAAIGELAEGRLELAERLDDQLAVAASGTHPFAAPLGELNRGERYDAILADHGDAARAQLVCALQVHVAVGDADTTLAVYNALRSHLPDIAALAANSPFHGGADTGYASWRAKIAELLPRQGVPPPLSSWEEFAAELDWGSRSEALATPGSWWWEVRPHPGLGTIELRVPDAQTTIAEAGAITAFAQCLVAWLVERHDNGEKLFVAPTWRIAENRWLAVRDGLDARLADLETGEIATARERLADLVRTLEPTASTLGCRQELARVPGLLAENGAERQRRVAEERGIAGLVGWMRDEFQSGCADAATAGRRS